MRFAFADPPYLGCGALYANDHPDAHDWDDLATHEALIERLVSDYPDGWALCCSSPSLRVLLPLRPTHFVEAREASVHRAPPSEDRWKIRSKTYPGLADAMADQWGISLSELASRRHVVTTESDMGPLFQESAA